eukprot:scaffold11493_cov36-Phaeocystis_antarctica.AAC.2
MQLRFDAQRARLVMTRGRVRDVIVKDRADTVAIGARQSTGCEDVVDLRPTRLLSGVHVLSIFAEVGMRTTKTGRRAPLFTALGARFGLSGRCGLCDWPPTCGSCRHLTAEGSTASYYSHETRGVAPQAARVGATWAWSPLPLLSEAPMVSH